MYPYVKRRNRYAKQLRACIQRPNTVFTRQIQAFLVNKFEENNVNVLYV